MVIHNNTQNVLTFQFDKSSASLQNNSRLKNIGSIRTFPDIKNAFSFKRMKSVRSSSLISAGIPASNPAFETLELARQSHQSAMVQRLNRDGGIAIYGHGPTGLALAIQAKLAGCNTTVYAPQREVPLYPLLNFREEQIQDLLKIGVSPEIMAPVTGFPSLNISAGNIFSKPPVANIYYGRLMQQLFAIAQKLDIQFVNTEVKPENIRSLSREHAVAFIATGVSRNTDALKESLQIQNLDQEHLQEMGVGPALQSYISAMIELPPSEIPDGKINLSRHHETGGAIVVLRQQNTIDSSKAWMIMQVPVNDTDQGAADRLTAEVRKRFDGQAQIEHMTNKFKVRPSYTPGYKATDSLAIVNYVSGKQVPVIVAADALGSSGFRTGAGAGAGLEDANLLRQALEHETPIDLKEWSFDLADNFKDVTKQRLGAEDAVFVKDNQYFTTSEGLTPGQAGTRLAQYRALDPIRSSGL